MNVGTHGNSSALSRRHVVRISFLLVISIFFLALGLLTSAGKTAHAQGGELTNQPKRGLIYDGLKLSKSPECRPGFEVPLSGAKRPICTHGPDPAPQGTNVFTSVAPRASGPIALAVCNGDGQSGKRFQVVYARAADVPDRSNTYRSSIQQWANEVDGLVSASARQTGGDRHVRYVHDATCQPLVLNLVLPTTGDDTFSSLISALMDQGYSRADRDYLVFVDANIYCGIATMGGDDWPGPENLHNTGPYYARIDAGCWNGPTAAHELMHNLGGVQSTAPHATRNGHCFDESDRMCYKDSGAVILQYTCDSSNELDFDCNHDDYFSTNPGPGSYLATHWNTANSEFLMTAAPTAQGLSSFEPIRKVRNIRVKWETSLELNLIGFNVWRKTKSNPWTIINPSAIPAKYPGQVKGGKYRFLDNTAGPGRSYKYKLELLRPSGKSDWSQVVEVK